MCFVVIVLYVSPKSYQGRTHQIHILLIVYEVGL